MDCLSTNEEARNLWASCGRGICAVIVRCLRKWPKYVQSQESVEEVLGRTAESLVRALTKTDRGRVFSCPHEGRAWLYTVASRAVIKYALERVEEETRKVQLPENGEIADLISASSIEDEIVERCRAEEAKKTWRAIRPIITSKLTVKQRACLFVHLNPGGIAAVARRFGMSANHVSVCANQARRKVRRLAASLLQSAAQPSLRTEGAR